MYTCSALLSAALLFNSLPFLSLLLNEEQKQFVVGLYFSFGLQFVQILLFLWTSVQEQMESLDASFMWPEWFIHSKLNFHMELNHFYRLL